MSNSKKPEEATAATLFCLGDKQTDVCVGQSSTAPGESVTSEPNFFIRVNVNNIDITVPNPMGIGQPVAVKASFSTQLKLEKAQLENLAAWIGITLGIDEIAAAIKNK